MKRKIVRGHLIEQFSNGVSVDGGETTSTSFDEAVKKIEDEDVKRIEEEESKKRGNKGRRQEREDLIESLKLAEYFMKWRFTLETQAQLEYRRNSKRLEKLLQDYETEKE